MPIRLKLGTSKIDITPSHPVPLAGFAVRSGLGPYTGVSYPLYARIYMLETEEQPEPVAGPEETPEPGERIPENAGMPERVGNAAEAGRAGRAAASRAVLISADLIWWGSDRVPAFKEAVRRRFGLEPEAVLLHGTHTHSGPQTSALFTSYLGVPDPAYLDDLEERVLKGIGEALAGLEPVRVESGAGTSSLAVNRRGHRVRPPERRETDRELSVIRFVREDGSPKGILVHYACHPVITDENKVSPDFVGVAMGAVEEKYGKDVVCGFLQGTCGDINPGHDMTEYRGGHELVMQAGLSFARDIGEVLDGPMEVRRAVPLRWRSRTVPLALAPLPEKAVLEKGRSLPGVHGEWHRLHWEREAERKPELPLEMTLLTITDGFSLLAMNAEVVVEYGLYLKRLSGGRVLPLPYTNGMFGYVPTEAILAEGGYEADESTIYFAMPSVFSPSVEGRLKEEMAGLLDPFSDR
ncbi:neutral/alkaline non-lysosomal ceramidase N-terminal domain-containing protein [Paenibacillus aurantius]|uniref:Neutral/alkaline non-lysosomal ceramidase N-terminal domain-containing protein n=1 Tax=Paenibacillus aurantius TaxID=2918900 RepID=A0AA96RF05_9BACL|nr:neutral/alkaline non-lysosomal ceramidase N-terminal domain-containing protein [Paenibacillus aurantius]WNQ10768.1 neutral/alkaline non-lysosomal ceramidase N-terminal domain-containing protein [Paenibacillus aurantius]